MGEIIVLNVVTPLFVQKLTRTLTQLFHFLKPWKARIFFSNSFIYIFFQSGLWEAQVLCPQWVEIPWRRSRNAWIRCFHEPPLSSFSILRCGRSGECKREQTLETSCDGRSRKTRFMSLSYCYFPTLIQCLKIQLPGKNLDASLFKVFREFNIRIFGENVFVKNLHFHPVKQALDVLASMQLFRFL